VRFSVNNIRVIDGGADISDETVQTKHTVRALNVGIPFISNISSYIQTFVQPHLSLEVNGTRYAVEGKTKPFADSQETTIDVNIDDLNLPYYLAYVPKDLLTFAMPSGRLDAKLVIVFVRKGKNEQTLAVKETLACGSWPLTISRAVRLSGFLALASPHLGRTPRTQGAPLQDFSGIARADSPPREERRH